MKTDYSYRTLQRQGLTLMELVVVLTILVGLATLLIPRITGVTGQTGVATSASMLQGISEAESRYEAQFNAIPSAWDGVLNGNGAMYSKLNPKLTGQLDPGGTALAPIALDAGQAASLNQAGLVGLHFQDEAWTGLPSDSGRLYQSIAANSKVCGLILPTGSITMSNWDNWNTNGMSGHNVLLPDKAFSINVFTPMWNNTFVVVGFGNEAGLKRNSVQDTPLFASATPSQYYARGLAVFMVPAAGTDTTSSAWFKAKYVGCIAPDGTCIMDNINSFNQGQSAQ